jgi:hypothetical protein
VATNNAQIQFENLKMSQFENEKFFLAPSAAT